MTDRSERVPELLFEGETVEETVDVGSSRLVVTSQRLLAFTPKRTVRATGRSTVRTWIG